MCKQEIDLQAYQQWNAHPGNASAKFMTSTSWPTPSSAGWGAKTTIPANGTYGFGNGAIVRAGPFYNQRSLYFTAVTGHNGHPLRKIDYRTGGSVVDVTPYLNSNGVCADPYLGCSTRHRPAIAHDFNRDRYWVFWNNADDDLSVNYHDHVKYAYSSDATNWTLAGLVRDSTGKLITTRMPVAAAYDPCADRIIVAFSNFGQAGTSGSMGDVPIVPFLTTDTCADTYGCTTQLVFVSIPATTPGGTWGPAIVPAGYSAVGPPALACENSCAATNCEVLFTGPDANRKIFAGGAGFNLNGSLYAIRGLVDTGGWTNNPIGITFNGASKAGSFVAVVQGDDLPWGGGMGVWFMSKRFSTNSWSGWSYVDGTGLGYGFRGGMGPLIYINESEGTYDLLLNEW